MSDDTNGGPVAAEELRLLIERIERLEEEKKAIADDIKGVYGEAKSRGFDTKAMKAIIRLRKLTPDQRREQEAMIDTYRAALGMLDGTPLGRWAVDRLTKREAPATEEQSAEDLAQYARAVEVVLSSRKASTAYLQRTLSIGYNSAAKLVERMERDGLVSKPDHVGRREVLAPAPEGSDADEVVIEEQEAPEPTTDDARRMGTEAATAGEPVTANPFPAFDERRAAWDEAWCGALGSDGMEIPDALKPTAKAKKPGKREDDEQ